MMVQLPGRQLPVVWQDPPFFQLNLTTFHCLLIGLILPLLHLQVCLFMRSHQECLTQYSCIILPDLFQECSESLAQDQMDPINPPIEEEYSTQIPGLLDHLDLPCMVGILHHHHPADSQWSSPSITTLTPSIQPWDLYRCSSSLPVW